MCGVFEPNGADSVVDEGWAPKPFRVLVREDGDPPYWISVAKALGPRDAERQAQEQLREYAIAARVVKVETA
jgi:hypothetical protein